MHPRRGRERLQGWSKGEGSQISLPLILAFFHFAAVPTCPPGPIGVGIPSFLPRKHLVGGNHSLLNSDLKKETVPFPLLPGDPGACGDESPRGGRSGIKSQVVGNVPIRRIQDHWPIHPIPAPPPFRTTPPHRQMMGKLGDREERGVIPRLCEEMFWRVKNAQVPAPWSTRRDPRCPGTSHRFIIVYWLFRIVDYCLLVPRSHFIAIIWLRVFSYPPRVCFFWGSKAFKPN